MTAPTPQLPPWTRAVPAVVAALAVVSLLLDGWLLAHHLVKMETANAFQLEYDALARDGFVVLASPPGYYADALHTWFFHLLVRVTPRLEHLATVLELFHYAAVAALGLGMRRRYGDTAGAVAAGLLLTAPVSPILSKHVISTAFVPLVGTGYVLAHLDLAAGGGRRALGRCVALLGLLLALNHGHAWIGLALLWRMARSRTFVPPAWSVLVGLLALSSGLFEIGWYLSHGQPELLMPHAGWWPRFDYDDVGQWARRAVFVEHGMGFMLPNLNLLFVLGAWALGVWARGGSAAPAGLGELLVLAIPFAFANTEAIVVWQTPLFVLLAWACRSQAYVGLMVVHLVASSLSQAWLYTHHGPPEPNFWALSSIQMRERVLDVLEREQGLTDAGFEHLWVDHPIGELHAPAILPGLSYLVDRVRPLPHGPDDRCHAVTGAPYTPPDGAVDVAVVERDHLWFTAWRGTPCPVDSRMPMPPVIVWSPSTGIVERTFPGNWTDTP
ncbi:MAG: hypothetical protein H6733_03485 [Alphaproteobacteria bacterium]|nr:hypothetical protein [Alphaproteobacteria bacterium]